MGFWTAGSAQEITEEEGTVEIMNFSKDTLCVFWDGYLLTHQPGVGNLLMMAGW